VEVNNRAQSFHFPYIRLEIRGPNDSVTFRITTEALIDTGFDGAIMVPHTLISGAVMPATSMRWKLADGSEVETLTYKGEARVLGIDETLDVTINALGDEVLIGRDLITRFRVILDHGSSVTFEP
jgi:clan AA aspartic protease